MAGADGGKAPELHSSRQDDECYCTNPSFMANLFRNDSVALTEGEPGSNVNEASKTPLMPPSVDELDAMEGTGASGSGDASNSLVSSLVRADSPQVVRRPLQPPTMAELEAMEKDDGLGHDKVLSNKYKVKRQGICVKELKKLLLPETLALFDPPLDKKDDEYWQEWNEEFRSRFATIMDQHGNHFTYHFLKKIFSPIRYCSHCKGCDFAVISKDTSLELFIADQGLVGRMKIECGLCGETERLVSCGYPSDIPSDPRLRFTLKKTRGDFLKKITHQETLHDLLELLHIAAIEDRVANKKKHVELAEFLLVNARRVCDQWCRREYRDLRLRKFLRLQDEVLRMGTVYKLGSNSEQKEMHDMMATSFRNSRESIYTILQAIKDSLIDNPTRSHVMFWIGIALLHVENYPQFKTKYDPRSCIRIDEGEYWALHDRYIGLDAPVGVKKIPVVFVLFEMPRFYHYIEYLEKTCGRRTKIFLSRDEKFELMGVEKEAAQKGFNRPRRTGVIITPEKHLDFLLRQEELARIARRSDTITIGPNLAIKKKKDKKKPPKTIKSPPPDFKENKLIHKKVSIHPINDCEEDSLENIVASCTDDITNGDAIEKVVTAHGKPITGSTEEISECNANEAPAEQSGVVLKSSVPEPGTKDDVLSKTDHVTTDPNGPMDKGKDPSKPEATLESPISPVPTKPPSSTSAYLESALKSSSDTQLVASETKKNKTKPTSGVSAQKKTAKSAKQLKKDESNVVAMYNGIQQLQKSGLLSDIITDPNTLNPETLMLGKFPDPNLENCKYKDETGKTITIEKINDQKWKTNSGLYIETLTHEEAPELFTTIAKSIITNEKPESIKQRLLKEAENMMKILLYESEEPKFYHYLKLLYKEGEWDEIMVDLDAQLNKKVLGLTREDIMEEGRITAKDYQEIITRHVKKYEAEKARKDGPRKPPRVIKLVVDPDYVGKVNRSIYQFRGVARPQGPPPPDAMMCAQITTELLRAQGYMIDSEEGIMSVIADPDGEMVLLVEGLDGHDEMQRFVAEYYHDPRKMMTDSSGYLIHSKDESGKSYGVNPKKAKKLAKKQKAKPVVIPSPLDMAARRVEHKNIVVGDKEFSPWDITAMAEGRHLFLRKLPPIDESVLPCEVAKMKAMHPYLRKVVNVSKMYKDPEELDDLMEWWCAPVPLEELDPSIPPKLSPSAPRTMNFKIRAQMHKIDGTTETRLESLSTDLTPRSKRGLSRCEEEREAAKRAEWVEIVNLKVAKAQEAELERKMIKNNWRIPDDYFKKGLDLPHRQMSMFDAMKIPYRLDHMSYVSTTAEKASVMSKITLLPFDETVIPESSVSEKSSQDSPPTPRLSKSQKKKAKKRAAAAGDVGTPSEQVKDQSISEAASENEATKEKESSHKVTARDRFKTCAHCNRDIKERIQLCAGCKKVAYCNAVCQKSNWKEHKKTCLYVVKKRTG